MKYTIRDAPNQQFDNAWKPMFVITELLSWKLLRDMRPYWTETNRFPTLTPHVLDNF